MIDSNLISLTNIKESFQLLEIYSNKVFHNLYSFFYIINQHQINSIILEFIFKVLNFLQFIFIIITWMPQRKLYIKHFISFKKKIYSFMILLQIKLNIL